MLVFSQTTGIVSLDGKPIAQGWSGNHAGKGNPDMQKVRGVGPLPRGLYTIAPWEESHGRLGPMVAALEPDPENDMKADDGWDRTAFFIHGPASNPAEYGQESMGCIVIPHAQRLAVKTSGETQLQVIA
jgi:hypothetical protein